MQCTCILQNKWILEFSIHNNILVPTYLIERTSCKMGVAFYHPTESIRKVMDELKECLSLEPEFKLITETMHIPPLHFNSIHYKTSSDQDRHLMTTVGVIFASIMFVGIVIEMIHYGMWKRKNQATLSVTEKRNESVRSALERSFSSIR